MTITSIKQQVKNAERASIFVDGKYSFSLSLNELVSEKLKIKQELSSPELDRLKKLSEDGKLKGRALEWVLNRPRSHREFKDYLYRKKVDPDMVAGLAAEFDTRGYLSDVNFSNWLIDMRRRGGKSDRAITTELMRKGVNHEIIAETLIKDNESEMIRLKTLLKKKLGNTRYKNDEVKLKQYLLRQGFSYSDIKEALKEVTLGLEHGGYG